MILLWVRKTICFSVSVYEVLIQSALCVDVVLLLSINKHMFKKTKIINRKLTGRELQAVFKFWRFFTSKSETRPCEITDASHMSFPEATAKISRSSEIWKMYFHHQNSHWNFFFADTFFFGMYFLNFGSFEPVPKKLHTKFCPPGTSETDRGSRVVLIFVQHGPRVSQWVAID